MVDWEQLGDQQDAFEVDDLFCCLGTTMKQAGSRPAFRKVDYEYPLAAARLARSAGVERFLLVSSMGADPQSRVFYSQVKGETEEAVARMGFRSTWILRPSLLLGERQQPRFGEEVAAVLMRLFAPLMRGPLAPYAAIHGRTVARAMIAAALSGSTGLARLSSHEVERLGRSLPPAG